MAEIQAFLSLILVEPMEAVHRMAFADWLKEEEDPRAELVGKWTEFYLPPPRIRWCGKGPDTELSNKIDSLPAAIKNLGCVLLHRLLVKRYPVPWAELLDREWLTGWTSERYPVAIRDRLHMAEWTALGFKHSLPDTASTQSVCVGAGWAAGKLQEHARLMSWHTQPDHQQQPSDEVACRKQMHLASAILALVRAARCDGANSVDQLATAAVELQIVEEILQSRNYSEKNIRKAVRNVVWAAARDLFDPLLKI